LLKEEARKKEAELAGLRGHLAQSASAKAGLEAKLLTVQTAVRALRTDFGRLMGHMEKRKSECVNVQEHHRCLGIRNTPLHKVLTYKEYRAVSGVFRTLDPPIPSPPSECVLPPQK
jgi:hypothetical protein